MAWDCRSRVLTAAGCAVLLLLIQRPAVSAEDGSWAEDGPAGHTIDRIIDNNTLQPRTDAPPFSVKTGLPENDRGKSYEQLQNYTKMTLAADHPKLAKMMATIKKVCSDALAPYEAKLSEESLGTQQEREARARANLTAAAGGGNAGGASDGSGSSDEKLIQAGWGATQDHNYAKMIAEAEEKFEDFFNKHVAFEREACDVRLSALTANGLAGDFLQVQTTRTLQASWAAYYEQKMSVLWRNLTTIADQARVVNASVAKLTVQLEEVRAKDLKAAQSLHLDPPGEYPRNATFNRLLATELSERQQRSVGYSWCADWRFGRLTELVRLWMTFLGMTQHRLKESCVLRLNEAQKATGVRFAMDNMSWPQGLHLGYTVEQGPISIVTTSHPKDASEGAEQLLSQLVEMHSGATSLAEGGSNADWGLQDEGLSMTPIKTALEKLKNQWDQKFQAIKARIVDRCNSRYQSTMSNFKAKEIASKQL